MGLLCKTVILDRLFEIILDRLFEIIPDYFIDGQE